MLARARGVVALLFAGGSLTCDATKVIVILMKTTQDDRAKAFMADIRAVCEKHGMVIAHEDVHGAYSVVEYDEELMEWIEDAAVDLDGQEPARWIEPSVLQLGDQEATS